MGVSSLQIPLMTFSRFHEESETDDVEHRSWDSSPFNINNGGYLEKPEQFWTDARAREDTKKLYRYYVARWGYSRNILNWEIMNEIGESSSYNQQIAKAWAEDIGGFMHTVDPYNHMVSLSSKEFYDEVYSASSLDFVSIHSYVWGADYPSSSADITSGVQKHFGKPVILTDYPKDIKAFYMKQNDDGKTVRGMDVLFPKIGEIIGGSQREESYDKLMARINELHMDMTNLWWYLDTRRFGTAPHSGFGLGFERLLLFVTGMSNIRDVIPFPRTPKSAEF